MITTHVLDTALGKPARRVPVSLERQDGATWHTLASGETDDDGRLRTLMDGQSRDAGVYRIRFDTAAYFSAMGIDGFYPYAEIVFIVAEPGGHYHVPLLVSPFAYSTYRGS